MTGLEILKAPGTTAGEIVDIIAEHCPPITPEHCDKLSCRECWLAWLVTGEPPKGGIEATVDLTQFRRITKAELSGDDPYKPYSKREKRLKKGNAPGQSE